MRDFIRSNIMGIIALYVALGGTALAVTEIHKVQIAPKNSVISKSIKNGQVTKGDLGSNAVIGSKVKNRGLSGTDLANDSVTGTQVQESSLDPSVLQTRVGGNCSAGQSVQSVNTDGTVNCTANGGPPSGAAGGDLSGTYPDPAIAGSVVNSAKVNDNSLTGSDVDESTLGQVPSATNSSQLGGSAASAYVKGTDSIPSGDLLGTYANPTIGPGVVGAAKLANNAVVGGAAGTVQDNSLLGTDVLESSLDSTVLQFRGSTTSCPGGQVATAISAAGNLTCVPDANSGGDITGVTLTGGSGLTGGGTTGSVNLGTDATILQSRVSGTCVDGTAIQSIAQNGTPACENSIPGPPTGSASGGLSGTYPSPSIANGAVTGGAGGAITDGTVTGADVNESTLAFPGSFTAFSGPGGGTTPPSVPPVFIGATATVPVAAGDRMTGVASIPLWAASTDAVFWALCYQLGAGSVFVMETSQTGTVTTNHLSYTAVGTTSSLAAGTYTVGFCGHSPSALSNEYVQGWVMVTH